MIIGVVGPLCSGKDTIGDIFVEKGFIQFSFGDILRNEMKEKDLKITRRNIQQYGNLLRKKEGNDAISKRIISRIKNNENYIIQGFRNPDEILPFRKIKKFVLIAVDSTIQNRFDRMKTRGRENDPDNISDFKKIDDMELLGNEQESYGFNIKECMNKADIYLSNNGTHPELNEKISDLINELYH